MQFQNELAPIPRYAEVFQVGKAPPVDHFECPYCRRRLQLTGHADLCISTQPRDLICRNCGNGWRRVNRGWRQNVFGTLPNQSRLELLLDL